MGSGRAQVILLRHNSPEYEQVTVMKCLFAHEQRKRCTLRRFAGALREETGGQADDANCFSSGKAATCAVE